MKNIKNIVKSLLLLVFLAGAVVAVPALADNNGANSNGFLNARASLKADALIKLDSSTGVVIGPNGVLRVMGAKVTSVSGGDINATASFGNSSLSFVVKTDAETKLNGKLLTDASVLSQLKAGDKISFAGTITSSTSSSIVVDGDHVVSWALYNNGSTTAFQGKIKTVNATDNSFTLKLKNGLAVKVVVLSSTVITLDGVAGALSSLEEGDEVKITGELNSDGNVITASKVSAKSGDNDDDSDDDNGDDDDKDDKENRGGFWGKIRNWFWK